MPSSCRSCDGAARPGGITKARRSGPRCRGCHLLAIAAPAVRRATGTFLSWQPASTATMPKLKALPAQEWSRTNQSTAFLPPVLRSHHDNPRGGRSAAINSGDREVALSLGWPRRKLGPAVARRRGRPSDAFPIIWVRIIGFRATARKLNAPILHRNGTR